MQVSDVRVKFSFQVVYLNWLKNQVDLILNITSMDADLVPSGSYDKLINIKTISASENLRLSRLLSPEPQTSE
jgi:hypothetical protein